MSKPLNGPPEDDFLVARVSRDGSVIAIDHPTDADWRDVLHAHHVLMQRLANRLVDQSKCPFNPSTTPIEQLQCTCTADYSGAWDMDSDCPVHNPPNSRLRKRT